MKHCNQCGTDNPDLNSHCSNCGAELPPSFDSQNQSVQTPPPIPGRELFGNQIPTYYRTFRSAVCTCLKDKYATFAGRATRSEYWYYMLFIFLVAVVLNAIGTSLSVFFLERTSGVYAMSGGTILINLFIALLTFIPSLAVSVRRLHDLGKSGWYVLLGLIPYLGVLILFVIYLLESQHVDNVYGLAPHERQ